MEAEVEKRVKAQNSMNHYQRKMEEAETQCQTFRQRANDLELEFQSWSTKAEEFCDGKRIDNPGRVEDLDRAINSYVHALSEQERLCVCISRLSYY